MSLPADRSASVAEVMSRRRMCRDFSSSALDRADVDAVLDTARRAPSAGFTHGVEFLVLDAPAGTGAYWDSTFADDDRAGFAHQGLFLAPVLIVVTVRPQAWPERYGATDKATTGLGLGTEAWPVPYWWVDAGMVVQNLLLAAEERGWGALFFGVFDHERAVAATFGVPDDRRLVGTIAMGHPAGARAASRSVGRNPRPGLGDVVHRGRWASVSRPLAPPDLVSVTELNNACVPAVTPATEDRMAEILACCDTALAVGPVGGVWGFSLVMGPGAAYSSSNYAWVSRRYDAFYYLDRVCIDAAHRGQGLARQMYRDIARDMEAGVPLVLEVNTEPRNDASLAFHAALGFDEVGRARPYGPDTEVAYLAATADVLLGEPRLPQ